jgi:hypothetical protein
VILGEQLPYHAIWKNRKIKNLATTYPTALVDIVFNFHRHADCADGTNFVMNDRFNKIYVHALNKNVWLIDWQGLQVDFNITPWMSSCQSAAIKLQL